MYIRMLFIDLILDIDTFWRQRWAPPDWYIIFGSWINKKMVRTFLSGHQNSHLVKVDNIVYKNHKNIRTINTIYIFIKKLQNSIKISSIVALHNIKRFIYLFFLSHNRWQGVKLGRQILSLTLRFGFGCKWYDTASFSGLGLEGT